MEKSYRKQVKLLFSAEVLAIIAAIFAAFILKAAWCGIVGFVISLIALAMSLVGIIKLRKANDRFKRSFKFLIASIILAILAIIFGAIGASGGADGIFWAIVVASVLNWIKAINNIIIINNIVFGCRELVIKEKGDANFGKHSVKIYGLCVLVAIVLAILIYIPAIGNNDGASYALSTISSVCSIIASVIYIITLGRTVHRLKK